MSRSAAAAMPTDSLGFRVIDYFKAHPDEVLTPRDIGSKFDIAPSAVDSMLAPAVQAGHLARGQSDAYGVIYRLPSSMRKGFPQPFTPSLKEAVKRNRARHIFKVDMTTVIIEKNVPVADSYVRRAAWPTIFEQMEVGDSFELPKAAKGAVGHATASYRKKNVGWAFVLRQVSETHVRVWRTS